MKGWQVALVVVACAAATFVGGVAGGAISETISEAVAEERARRAAKPRLVPVP